jgi:hypothetical protein
MSHVGYLRDQAARAAARTFEAKFHSQCTACEETINPGDLCRWDDDQVFVHADCELATPEGAPAAETCGTCFQTRSVSGACGCIG